MASPRCQHPSLQEIVGEDDECDVTVEQMGEVALDGDGDEDDVAAGAAASKFAAVVWAVGESMLEDLHGSSPAVLVAAA